MKSKEAQTDSHLGDRGAGVSAFDGYQAFGSGAVSVSQASSAQASPEDEEPGSPKTDQDTAINNRVAGGAGKRLSVEDLQVVSCIHAAVVMSQALTQCSPRQMRVQSVSRLQAVLLSTSTQHMDASTELAPSLQILTWLHVLVSHLCHMRCKIAHAAAMPCSLNLG